MSTSLLTLACATSGESPTNESTHQRSTDTCRRGANAHIHTTAIRCRLHQSDPSAFIHTSLQPTMWQRPYTMTVPTTSPTPGSTHSADTTARRPHPRRSRHCRLRRSQLRGRYPRAPHVSTTLQSGTIYCHNPGGWTRLLTRVLCRRKKIHLGCPPECRTLVDPTSCP